MNVTDGRTDTARRPTPRYEQRRTAKIKCQETCYVLPIIVFHSMYIYTYSITLLTN